MKKILLTTVCVLSMGGGAFAQGTVNWGALSPAYITVQTNATQYSPLFPGFGSPVGGTVGTPVSSPTGPAYYYELLYAPFTGVQASIPTLGSLLSWKDAGLSATNQTANAGRLAPVNGNTGATVPWPNGVTNSIVLVGWSANLGTSWLAVSNTLANWNSMMTSYAGQNAFFGVSATGYINPGTVNPGVNVFANTTTTYGLPIYSPNMQLYLLPVPEPGTLALAGLGGLSLLFFRRRK